MRLFYSYPQHDYSAKCCPKGDSLLHIVSLGHLTHCPIVAFFTCIHNFDTVLRFAQKGTLYFLAYVSEISHIVRLLFFFKCIHIFHRVLRFAQKFHRIVVFKKRGIKVNILCGTHLLFVIVHLSN